MKQSWSITILVSFIFAIFGISIADAQVPVGNSVSAQFGSNCSYFTNEDYIENIPLTWNKEWSSNLINQLDGGPAICNPKVVFKTNENITIFSPDDPSIFSAQPSLGLYTWDFKGMCMEEPGMLPISAYYEDPLLAKPRFTASRTVEPEILTDEVTLQTITIVFELQEALPPEVDWFMIWTGTPVIGYQDHTLVEGRFVSQSSVGGWDNWTDGVTAGWGSNPNQIEVGKKYIFEANLEITKSKDLKGTPIFKPEVDLLYARWISEPEIITGTKVTINDPDGIISATFTSDNVVDWDLSFADSSFSVAIRPFVSQVTTPPPPFHVLIPAIITIKPETLNTNSKGKFTAFVQLPEQYDLADVDISTVTCEGASALKGTIDQGFLVLKFNRQDLNEIGPGENVEFMVTGELFDGSIFEGTDIIRVK